MALYPFVQFQHLNCTRWAAIPVTDRQSDRNTNRLSYAFAAHMRVYPTSLNQSTLPFTVPVNKSLRSVSKERSFYGVNRSVPLPYLYRPVFCQYYGPFIRTVYTHRLYARGKTSSLCRKSFEFQVWIWRRFLPVTGSKGSWYTTVKATKPLTGTVVTWNCFAHFLRNAERV